MAVEQSLPTLRSFCSPNLYHILSLPSGADCPVQSFRALPALVAVGQSDPKKSNGANYLQFPKQKVPLLASRGAQSASGTTANPYLMSP